MSSHHLFPKIAVRNALVFLTLLAVSILIADRALIPYSERAYWISGLEWLKENVRINLNNEAKNPTRDGDPTWSSAGFPTDPQKRRKTKRIAIIGDSFVWGGGYANLNDIWWRQLERVLEERGYYDVEVIAMGYRGASTRQELDYARKYLPAYDPDLVVWTYVTNDPDEATDERTPVKQIVFPHTRAYRAVEKAGQNLLPNLFFLLGRAYRDKQFRLIQGPEHGYAYDDWELQILTGDSFESYKATVGRLGEFLARLAVPYFMITLPNRPNSEHFLPRYQPILPLFEGAGIPTINTLPAFVGTFGEGGALIQSRETEPFIWGINPADGHPSVLATRFFAEQAADYLEKHHSELLGSVSARKGFEPSVNDWNPGTLLVAGAKSGVGFAWPTTDDADLMLRMPEGRPYVQLNFERPVLLRSIRISGAGLTGARLAVTQIDPARGWDRNRPIDLGEKVGGSLVWNTASLSMTGAINTLRIVAETHADQRVSVTWESMRP